MRRTRHSESVESLVAAFVDRLGEVIERDIDSRTRILAAEWLEVALASPPASDKARIRRLEATQGTPEPHQAVRAERPADIAAQDATALTTAAAPPRRHRPRTWARKSSTIHIERPAPASPSPEEERRDSEFARLRAILKPSGHDDSSGVGDTLSARAPLAVVAPPTDPLRLLEGEVRDQAQGLAQLPPTSCTARIAAWAGRVRSYEETNGNRVAADLLLDKLRVLARAMDAGRIEALSGSWRTTDWPSYIRTNEALAETSQNAETLADSRPERSGEPEYPDIWSQPS